MQFEYDIIRSSRRKTLAMSIEQGRVIVRAPALANEPWIHKWVASKSRWVIPRLEAQQESWNRYAVRIEQGAEVLVLGAFTPLHWSIGPKSVWLVSHTQLKLQLASSAIGHEKEQVAALLKQRLKKDAKRYLTSRVAQLSQRTGLEPSQVKVKDYKRKWGQCSSTGEVTLNWRLYHLAPELIDYVIIHELCHLKEMNHSAKFWRWVARFCPDYLQHQDTIKTMSPLLIW